MEGALKACCVKRQQQSNGYAMYENTENKMFVTVFPWNHLRLCIIYAYTLSAPPRSLASPLKISVNVKSCECVKRGSFWPLEVAEAFLETVQRNQIEKIHENWNITNIKSGTECQYIEDSSAPLSRLFQSIFCQKCSPLFFFRVLYISFLIHFQWHYLTHFVSF